MPLPSRLEPPVRPPGGLGVKYRDVFYFGDRDLSWEAEDAVIRRVRLLAGDLGAEVEVRHERRFGSPHPKLSSTRDGMDRCLVACTCVGIEVTTGGLYAPDGLDGPESGTLRMNPRNARPDLFRRKAGEYRARWPWLAIAE